MVRFGACRPPALKLATYIGIFRKQAVLACVHGHPGQAYGTRLTLAEWLCRTADRIDPARVRGPFRRLGRGTSASDPASLRSLLQ